MNAFVPLLAALLGLFLGTLLNLVIIRLPRERTLGGWPHCTRCGRPLALWQYLPLIGWLSQAGRARCCGRQLHWIYPLIELLSTIACLLFALSYGVGALFFYLVFVTIVLLV